MRYVLLAGVFCGMMVSAAWAQMSPGTINAKQTGTWTVTATQGTGTNLHMVCDSGCGGSSFADNGAFTFGTSNVGPLGAVVDDVGTNAVSENSAGAPRMSGSRILYGNLRTATGTELIGSQTSSASIPVVIASDQGAVKIDRNTVASANNDGACISVTGSSTAVLASFASRRAAILRADPTNTQRVYLKFGATATTGDFPLDAGDSVVVGGTVAYTGAIDGIAASGTQSVCVAEF